MLILNNLQELQNIPVIRVKLTAILIFKTVSTYYNTFQILYH